MRVLIAAILALAAPLTLLGCDLAQSAVECATGNYTKVDVAIRFERMGAYDGERVNWRVTGGCVSGDDRSFELRDDDHGATIDDARASSVLVLRAWIDLDGDGLYDAPPVDASWRVEGSTGRSSGSIFIFGTDAQFDLRTW